MGIGPGRGEEIFGAVVPAGEVIVREGERGDALYIIQSGAVEVSRQTKGRKWAVARLEGGDFFGEMALLDDERRSATVTALVDSRLLRIERRSFDDRIRRDPGMALHLLRTLSRRIERTCREGGIDDAMPSPRVRTPRVLPQRSNVDLAEGETLFRQGEAGDRLYFIVDGLLEVRREEEGESRIVARLRRGDVVGETAVLTGRCRSATVVATEPSRLFALPREAFLDWVRAEPRLAGRLVRLLVLRLRRILGDSSAAAPRTRRRRPRLAAAAGGRPLRAAVVSLSTCGGCPAALIDSPAVFSGTERAVEVVYGPMLMDEPHLGRVDVAIVDGAVRGREDLDRLLEIRAKSRILLAFGTCATNGGIPALANRFDLEDVLAASFGSATDTFGHYLAGDRDDGSSLLADRLGLLRTASGIGAFVKVDGYLPGCPPPAAQIELAILALASGRAERAEGAVSRRPVCSECPRTACKDPVTAALDFPGPGRDGGACLASRGVVCLGFMTSGGCGAPCPRGGLPCWGCRGATEPALRKLSEGDSLEGIALDGLARFSKLRAEAIRPAMKRARLGAGGVGIGHHEGGGPAKAP